MRPEAVLIGNHPDPKNPFVLCFSRLLPRNHPRANIASCPQVRSLQDPSPDFQDSGRVIPAALPSLRTWPIPVTQSGAVCLLPSWFCNTRDIQLLVVVEWCVSIDVGVETEQFSGRDEKTFCHIIPASVIALSSVPPLNKRPGGWYCCPRRQLPLEICDLAFEAYILVLECFLVLRELFLVGIERLQLLGENFVSGF